MRDLNRVNSNIIIVIFLSKLQTMPCLKLFVKTYVCIVFFCNISTPHNCLSNTKDNATQNIVLF